ncbi:MAG: hypothetical protein JRD93_06730 [Deltaproteobacteria bacterium]|nr:hypothetical protein [Deltaproteobacteria bacterium]MBW2661672.1 hypothetical protein [Deltaproteobacteria bacterium]
MKKLMWLLLVMLMVTVIACDKTQESTSQDKIDTHAVISKDQILGQWNCVDLRLANGMSMESIAKMQTSFTFNEDGMVKLKSPSASTFLIRHYKIEKDQLVVMDNSEQQTVIFYMEEGKLIVDDKDADSKMIYQKVQ